MYGKHPDPLFERESAVAEEILGTSEGSRCCQDACFNFKVVFEGEVDD
jgi:hypothetical protein